MQFWRGVFLLIISWNRNYKADSDFTFSPSAYVIEKAEAGKSDLKNKIVLSPAALISPSSILMFLSFS